MADRPLTLILMAKRAVPGRVKTRLRSALTFEQAALTHRAMLDCAVERFGLWVRQRISSKSCVIALTDAQGSLQDMQPPGWAAIGQGEGDLGARMARVWQATRGAGGGGGGPVLFLGCDSPDVPLASLDAVEIGLASSEVVVGPAHDGGYWCLAARQYSPALLTGIDWGGPDVYHQTCRAAAGAGLSIAAAPLWHDVDTPADLAALLVRLRSATEPSLVTLAERLEAICKGTSIMDDAIALQPAADDTASTAESVVLIVDDNVQNVELFQAYLEALPCTTLTAYDGREAISLIEDPDKPTPDLILLDVMMPKMSGFEVCRKLKEDPATRTIPILMVTALNELGDIERGVESGADDFLTKPVNKLELITRVKSLLRVRHLKLEHDRAMAYIRQIETHRAEGETPTEE